MLKFAFEEYKEYLIFSYEYYCILCQPFILTLTSLSSFFKGIYWIDDYLFLIQMMFVLLKYLLILLFWYLLIYFVYFKDISVTPQGKCYVINSQVHRIKQRVWQAALVIVNYLPKVCQIYNLSSYFYQLQTFSVWL